MLLEQKLINFKAIIGSLTTVLVSFSGGVDSTFLLKVCYDTLGRDRVLSVTIRSEATTAKEIDFADEAARLIGVKHLVLPLTDLDNSEFVSNTPDRCYHCKKHHYKALMAVARDKHMDYIVDGSNYSDLTDYRPGAKALKELGIRSPLQEAQLNKEDIRELSRIAGLPTWNKPSRACLASRFPYGTRITFDALGQVARAEEVLESSGFTQYRVRHYGNLARIEIPPAEFSRVMEKQILTEIVAGIKRAGYTYVTLDLEGYRTGSLNEVLLKSI